MKYSLGITDSLEEISSLSHSIVFLYFFVLITEEGFLVSPCYFWNSSFKWVFLSFPPLLFSSLHFTAVCKASSHSHLAFLHFFFLGMVLIPVSCTMSWTSIHSSSGTLSIRSSPLNLFLTSHVWSCVCVCVSAIYMYVYFFQVLFPFRLLQNIEQNSVFSMLYSKSLWLSILNRVVSIVLKGISRSLWLHRGAIECRYEAWSNGVMARLTILIVVLASCIFISLNFPIVPLKMRNNLHQLYPNKTYFKILTSSHFF